MRRKRHVGVDHRGGLVHLSSENDLMKGLVDRLITVDLLPLAAVDGVLSGQKHRLTRGVVDFDEVLSAVDDQPDEQQYHYSSSDYRPFLAAQYFGHAFTSRDSLDIKK